MNSQVKILSNESDDQPSLVQDSPVSPIALQENVKRLVMTVISPGNLKESFGRLNQDGSLLRMSRGYAQANLDGFLESSCMTFPRWGILSDGVVGELQMSEHAIEGNGYSLLPTPRTEERGQHNSQDAGISLSARIKTLPTVTTPRPHDSEKTAGVYIPSQNQVDLTVILGKNHGLKLQPAFAEWMMGFPPEWSALDASEIQLSRNKSTRSSKRLQTLKEV